MLNVQKYLIGMSFELGSARAALEALSTEHGITCRINSEFGDEFYVLNYNQIESVKTSPIAMECRALILDEDFEVMSRSFDRFFNHGEAPEFSTFDYSKATIFEKLDGSLINVYFNTVIQEWCISTRGTAFAESECQSGDKFYDLVLRSLPYRTGDSYVDMRKMRYLANMHLERGVTYMFEFTSAENRVVTRYSGYNLHFLAARRKNGEYVDRDQAYASAYEVFCCNKAASYTFDSIEHCLETARSLPDFKEGYVVYVDNKPVCKIKSPAYVAVHHIRGEGLTPKRMVELVCTGESAEYLSYFPEDEVMLAPYINAYEGIISACNARYAEVSDIEDQRDFAKAILDFPHKDILFALRTGEKKGEHRTVEKVITGYTKQAKMACFRKMMKIEEE